MFVLYTYFSNSIFKYKYQLTFLSSLILLILAYLFVSPNIEWNTHTPSNNWLDITDHYEGNSLSYTLISILKWFGVITLLSITSIPITLTFFQKLKDRGWIFSKIISLLSLTIPTWVVTYLQILPFRQNTLSIVIISIIILNAIVLIKRWKQIKSDIKTIRNNLIIQEIIFLVLFLLYCGIASLSPEIYPSQSLKQGENAPDLIAINSVLQSPYMPPIDIGLYGNYITDYYHFSFFALSSLIHITKTYPPIAIHLFGAIIWSIIACLGISIIVNILSFHKNISSKQYLSAGTLTVLLLNFGLSHISPIKVFELIQTYIINDFNLDNISLSYSFMTNLHLSYYFLETNFYTFLVGNHAHPNVLSIAFTLFGIALAINYIKENSQRNTSVRFLSIFSIGTILGVIVITNTWDFPIIFVILTTTIIVMNFIKKTTFKLSMQNFILQSTYELFAIILIVIFISLPFIMHNQSSSLSINLGSPFSISAIDIFIFYFNLFIISIIFLLPYTKKVYAYLSKNKKMLLYVGAYLSCLPFIILFGSLSILYITVPIISFQTILLIKRYKSSRNLLNLQISFFLLLLTICISFIPIGVNIISIKQVDIFGVGYPLANTNGVLKFYHIIWNILVFLTIYTLIIQWGKVKAIFRYFTVSLIIVYCLYSIIFIFGRMDIGYQYDDITLDSIHPTKSNLMLPTLSPVYRYKTRSNHLQSPPNPIIGKNEPMSSNRTVMNYYVPYDLNNEINSLLWMRNNIGTNAVVLEKYGDTSHNYNLGGRVSTVSGFSTILASELHSTLYRNESSHIDIQQRIQDINEMYSPNTTIKRTIDLMDKYNITHVFIGYSEQLAYGNKVSYKFTKDMTDTLEVIYSNQNVTILRRI